jgi:hypothetical protein
LARALVASNLDAIIAVSDISIEAAKAASGTIPIVMSFSTGDPVAAGFATSITRPGGNITGVVMLAPELNAKRLTLLHEAMPKARRIAALAVSEHRYETILQTIRTIAAGAGKRRLCNTVGGRFFIPVVSCFFGRIAPSDAATSGARSQATRNSRESRKRICKLPGPQTRKPCNLKSTKPPKNDYPLRGGIACQADARALIRAVPFITIVVCQRTKCACRK